MSERPIIIGMNNPISTMPGHELYPAPEGCTGHRLWRLLHARTGAFRQQYLNAFERRNLVRGLEYNKRVAKMRAGAIVAELWGSGRVVILLGQDVRRAFGHPELLVHPQEISGCTWRQLPHPSGRNLWYNDPDNRKVAELLLEELYTEYVGQKESAR
jgi:hypothetical protein